jgi:dihydrofolate reductase
MAGEIWLVAAMDRERGIGHAGGMPWQLPADLRHFRALTLGHPVLMGRRTWRSLPGALEGRRNLVLSRDPSFAASGAEVFAEADAAADAVGEARLMVIGGAQLYAHFLPRADVLALTLIDGVFAADTWFPRWDERAWQLVEDRHHAADARNPHALRFTRWTRRVADDRRGAGA